MSVADPPPIEDIAISSIQHPVIPRGTSWTYLDEGAANIVYRIHTRPVTPRNDAAKVSRHAARAADLVLDHVVPPHLRPFDGMYVM